MLLIVEKVLFKINQIFKSQRRQQLLLNLKAPTVVILNLTLNLMLRKQLPQLRHQLPSQLRLLSKNLPQLQLQLLSKHNQLRQLTHHQLLLQQKPRPHHKLKRKPKQKVILIHQALTPIEIVK